MLLYRRTSVMESSAQTLVNTVNCVGVMGKGIAHEFKKREPAMFSAYKRVCDANLLEPGKLWLWQGSSGWILNFPTKVHWRNPSRLEWIEAGLRKFADQYASRNIREISFPRLGCGNGGLDWNEVRPLMERYLSPLDLPVYIHDYVKDIGLPEHLEVIAVQLRDEVPATPSFGSFLSGLHRAIQLANSDFIELGSEAPFSAEWLSDDAIRFATGQGTWTVDSEGLRDIWDGLLSGLVTSDRAMRAQVGNPAQPLLSVFSLLPQVRAIEVQKSSASTAELAIELRPQLRTIAAMEPTASAVCH